MVCNASTSVTSRAQSTYFMLWAFFYEQVMIFLLFPLFLDSAKEHNFVLLKQNSTRLCVNRRAGCGLFDCRNTSLLLHNLTDMERSMSLRHILKALFSQPVCRELPKWRRRRTHFRNGIEVTDPRMRIVARAWATYQQLLITHPWKTQTIGTG